MSATGDTLIVDAKCTISRARKHHRFGIFDRGQFLLGIIAAWARQRQAAGVEMACRFRLGCNTEAVLIAVGTLTATYAGATVQTGIPGTVPSPRPAFSSGSRSESYGCPAPPDDP
jgi:hypothetical protein